MFGLFSKKPTAQPSETENEASQYDTKTAAFIQQKAQIGTMFANRLSDPNEDREDQLRHYMNVRDDLVIKLDTIEDEFNRGFATHCIIDMCVAADDLSIARALLAGVRDDFIREKIFETAPQLKIPR